jgi:tyrosyl-tRNA synthetase
MKLSQELQWRGLIKDRTFDNEGWLDEPRTFYLGIDASANSLTIGNLAVLMLAMHLMKNGWQGVLLTGGGTSLIGDPGGKAEERTLPDKQLIAENVAAIRGQLEAIFKDQAPIYEDNAGWLAGLKLIDFLREVGKNFSMTELVQRDFIADRMGQGGSGISYAEFSYSLLQGYDYWQLYKRHKAVLQIGGSDQWGNMLSGVALIRKQASAEAQALSMPLVINKVTGVKFGKSETGAIWLDPEKTSANDFYQFWINTEDQNVGDYLKVFTFLPKEKIEKIMTSHVSSPEQRLAQVSLARAVTALVHGATAADEAESYADTIINPGGDPAGGKALRIKAGMPLIDALMDAGLVDSRSEARRLIDSKGIYINNQPFTKDAIESADFEAGRLILRRGKKFQHSVILELEQ